ncbi:MAG: ribonuclease R [Clostridiales bacterium]|nr:ribonuclease R [Clostridiales bacterium]
MKEYDEKDYNEIIKTQKEKIESFIKSPYYSEYLTDDYMAALLEVPSEDLKLFRYIIHELLEEGKLVLTKKKKLAPASKAGYYTGVIRTTERGNGFVTCEELSEDVYIPKENLNGACHMDTVLIAAGMYKGRPAGFVKKVIKREILQAVGIYQTRAKSDYVFPDNHRLFKRIEIKGACKNKELKGHKVVVKITEPPNKKRIAAGVIIGDLGEVGEKGVDVLSVMAEHDIPGDFPQNVKDAVKKIPMTTEREDLTYREDFRDVLMVTIDGEDAKDLDDAVSCKKLPNGNFELGVYIADVSHYVKEKSPIDREAFKRGTSTYLADRVIPMLPKELSNGICSLNQGEDRLSLCCIMEINSGGRVVDHRTVKGVINVDRRMSYTVVYDLLTNDASEYKDEYKDFLPMFFDMKELRDILWEKRRRRGAVDFNLSETKVILDDEGKAVDIVARYRNTATSIIEEFMIAANETVAEEFFNREVPFMYRSHETPDEEKFQMLKDTVGKLGYVLKGGRKSSKTLQALLDQVKDSPKEMMINMLALRSMQQARYTGDALGHYGLASKYYCHFTSPIRRYPDLYIHRIISLCIDGVEPDELQRRFGKTLEEDAGICSENERRAEAAERDSVEMKKVEYMADKVGQTFEGVISNVTAWGIYVQLPNTVEGMVAYKSMTDDHYSVDEEGTSCMGDRTHKTYTIGDRVTVLLERADVEMHHLDFVFEENAAAQQSPKPKAERKKSKGSGRGRKKRRK